MPKFPFKYITKDQLTLNKQSTATKQVPPPPLSPNEQTEWEEKMRRAVDNNDPKAISDAFYHLSGGVSLPFTNDEGTNLSLVKQVLSTVISRSNDLTRQIADLQQNIEDIAKLLNNGIDATAKPGITTSVSQPTESTTPPSQLSFSRMRFMAAPPLNLESLTPPPPTTESSQPQPQSPKPYNLKKSC